MATVGKVLADTLDAADEVSTLADEQLADRLSSGRWTTTEVHEAARRLRRLGSLRRRFGVLWYAKFVEGKP